MTLTIILFVQLVKILSARKVRLRAVLVFPMKQAVEILLAALAEKVLVLPRRLLLLPLLAALHPVGHLQELMFHFV